MKRKITNFIFDTLHKITNLQQELVREGSPIRSKRLRKFKKKGKGLSIVAQMVAIWCLSIFAGTYLISNTGAYFNDIETIENFIGAAGEFPDDPDEPEGWDRSSLEFTKVGGFCTQGFEGKIYSEIANVGDRDMLGPTNFYLYKTETGSPNKNNSGELVYQGTISPLPGKESSNNKTMLTFSPDLNTMSPGKYKFMADQRPGHSYPKETSNQEREQKTWGEEIVITQENIDACKRVVTANEPPEAQPILQDVKSLSEFHTSDSIKLAWELTENEDFAFIRIYRNGQLHANKIVGTTFEDKGLSPSTKYIYKIILVDQKEQESAGKTIEVTTDEKLIEDQQPPGDVSTLTWSEKNNSGIIEIKWNKPSDQDYSYTKIYRDNELIVAKTEATEFIEKTRESQHIYKITTVDKTGNESAGAEITVTIEKKK